MLLLYTRCVLLASNAFFPAFHKILKIQSCPCYLMVSFHPDHGVVAFAGIIKYILAVVSILFSGLLIVYELVLLCLSSQCNCNMMKFVCSDCYWWFI